MNKIKKFLVIGNPINHSLSPELQNYWLKKNNINAIYDKQRLDIDDLKDFVLKIKSKEIAGANITVPFKKEIILINLGFVSARFERALATATNLELSLCNEIRRIPNVEINLFLSEKNA